MASSIELAVLAPLALSFLAFLITCGVYLLARTIKTRMHHLAYMSVYFFFTAFYYILVLLSTIGILVFWTFRITIVVIGFSCGLLFIKESFFKSRKVPLWIILACFLAISITYFAFGLLRDIADGTDLDTVVGRLGMTISSILDLLLVASWQAQVSFRAYRKYKNEPFEPHVKSRYLLFGMSSLIIMAIAVIDLTGTLASMYLGLEYGYITIIMLFMMLVYTVLAYLTWVMPSRFKKFLNRNYKPVESDTTVSEDEIMKDLQNAKKNK